MSVRIGGNRTQAKATNKLASQPTTGGSGKQVEVIIIGDVYWDTVVVPLPRARPNPERPENDDMYARGLRRFDRRAGAWLLKRFIDRAQKQVEGEWAKKNPDKLLDKIITVRGYREPLKDDAKLGTEKWRRAVTRVKLFPKGVGGDMKQQIYRIEHSYGWIESRVAPLRDQYDSLYTPIFEPLNGEIRKQTPNEDQPRPRIVVVNDDNLIFRHFKDK